jgi:hypothetical protein
MAKRFLTHLDMSGNQILNAVLTTSGFERLSSDPTTGNFEGRVYYNTASDLLKVYNGTAWISVGAITNIQGTTNEVTVSITDGVATISLPETISANLSGNASTATALATARTISLGGDLSGSTSFDGSANVTITATIAADSVALGTDTSGDYVQSISSGTGVTVTSGTGEGSTPSIAIGQSVATTASPTFAGVTGGNVQVGITGDNEIDTSSGNLTIDSVGGTVTVDDDLIVTGNLTVSGTTTTVTTETILLADNIITLNSNATGTPTENAGIEVERGDSTNVSLRWNETNDTWEATRDGSAYAALVLAGDDIATSDITNFTEDVQDVVGGMVSGSNSISATYNDGSNSLSLDTTLATTSYLSKTSGLAVDIASVETKLVTDGFAKKVAANVGNGTATSYAVQHNLGSRDVQVQVFDNSSYDTIECDVVRTDTNTVTVSFTTAPSSNAFRVVVVG